jgi:hypothetical protein
MPVRNIEKGVWIARVCVSALYHAFNNVGRFLKLNMIMGTGRVYRLRLNVIMGPREVYRQEVKHDHGAGKVIFVLGLYRLLVAIRIKN